MIKLQITYFTINGDRKTRNVTYANPDPDVEDSTFKEFADRLYALTTNTIKSVYKIDQGVLLDDDSDDIVTPILGQKQDPQLSLSANEVSVASGGSTAEITVSRLGDGVISVTETSNTGTGANRLAVTTSVNGNVITITGSGSNGEITLTVNVAETDLYDSATATVKVTVGSGVIQPEEPPVEEPDQPVNVNILEDSAFLREFRSYATSCLETGDQLEVFTDDTKGELPDGFNTINTIAALEFTDSFPAGQSSAPVSLAFGDRYYEEQTVYVVFVYENDEGRIEHVVEGSCSTNGVVVFNLEKDLYDEIYDKDVVIAVVFEG